MDHEWTGKAVSIECNDKLGVFQGIISQCTPTEITIVRTFRNGVPTRNQSAEVTLRSSDIQKISLLPTFNNISSTITSNNICKKSISVIALWNDTVNSGDSDSCIKEHQHQPQQQQTQQQPNVISPHNQKAFEKVGNSVKNASKSQLSIDQKKDSSSLSSSTCISRLFGNLVPPKVEVRFGPALTNTLHRNNDNNRNSGNNNFSTNIKSTSFCGGNSSKPIDIITGSNCSRSLSEQQQKNNYVKANRNGTGNNNSNSNGNGSCSTNGSNHGSVNGFGAKCIGSFSEQQQHNNYVKVNRNGIGNNNSNGNGNGNGSCSTNGSNHGSVNSFGGNRPKYRNKQSRRDVIKHRQTFDTCIDDTLLNEDFDFESNLALFDKKALWNSLDAGKKPDLVQQAVSVQQQKYRHDENILEGEPAQMRQIESLFEGSQDYITDEGLIIPTVPLFVRSKIELCAEKCGFSIQRQIDFLARGTTDLALLLLGGARRLTPKNRHQWPTIVIICEKSTSFRTSNVGAAIGRHLASLGLKVLLYLEDDPTIEQNSIEVSLFKSTSNAIIYTVDALPTPDLVILSANKNDISNCVRKWLNENRASVLAVDPPPNGIKDVCIKHAILPILPLNGISSEQLGKLYLCNLTIPDKFYRDAGVKYKSPFGHKFVIPIHSIP